MAEPGEESLIGTLAEQRLEMVGKIFTNRNIVRVVVIQIAALMVIGVACGSGESTGITATVTSGAATGPTTSVITDASNEALEDAIVPESVAEVIDDPIVPAVEPEVDSREAMVLGVFEDQMSAINHQDWDAWVTFCDPTLPFPPKVDQIAFLMTEYGVRYATLPSEPDLAGYNMKNVTVKFYGEDTASTAGDVYNYDDMLQTDVHDLWIRVDENWYADSFYCKGPGSKNAK